MSPVLTSAECWSFIRGPSFVPFELASRREPPIGYSIDRDHFTNQSLWILRSAETKFFALENVCETLGHRRTTRAPKIKEPAQRGVRRRANSLAPRWNVSFSGASVAVDVLPSSFNSILIVSAQMQFMFG
jgi:hypothetical protein